MYSKVNRQKDVRSTITSVGSDYVKPVKRKQVSYDCYEKYIQDYEEQLMRRFRIGYSALHKKLVKEKSQQVFNNYI